jgi:pimeloyl-ACP methyl ester carboxylesterase
MNLGPAGHRGSRRVVASLVAVALAGLLAAGLLPGSAAARAAAAGQFRAGAAAPAGQFRAGTAAPAGQFRAGTAAPAGQPTAGAAAAERVRVGSMMLRRCARAPLAYCGHLAVPLDYSSAASPHIQLGFRWLPATDGHPAAGTVLAVEGGPGFATTGTQAAYRAMMGPLTQTRNLLLVDLRGTGGSSPVTCQGLERYGRPQHQYGAAFDRLVATCGRQLDHTWHYRHGGWVHAADLFNTAYSARDVAGVLLALRPGWVDLYGDSYGSWFAQVFASRYPGQLRSVTLDSTYQVLGLDPWYVTTVVTARSAFAQACARWVACARAAGRRGAWAQIAALAARLARAPVSGRTVTEAGTPGAFTVTVETLVNLVNNAGFDPVIYADLAAAARALLHDGDSAPLLRLAALSIGFDDTNFPLPEFSDGLYFAVACTDYVQLFSRTAAPAVRSRQYLAALRHEPRGVFAPFTVGQWTQLDQYTEAYSGCLDWPSPARLVPPITRRPPLVPARLPVLILSGTFDSLTPWLDGAALVARQMGPSARVVRVANLTHVTLQDGNDSCPAAIYQHFIRDPGGLAHQDTSCAGRVAPIHAVGVYPVRLAAAVPATATRGNTAGHRALQAAAVAVASVGDETSRWPLLAGSRDLGLRGGQVSFAGGTVVRISLRHVRWVTNASIDGTARWDQLANRVTARLTVHLPGAAPVRLTARWRLYAGPGQPAVITGSQGGTHLAAVCPAP